MKTIMCVTLAVMIATCFSNNTLAQDFTRLDTIYTPPGYVGGQLMASIFIPNPSLARGMGVVLAHYRGGDRLTSRIWCDTLAARGYVAMTIDYQDIGDLPALYHEPVTTFKIAVEFLRRNATLFGVNPNKIVGFGQSQGSLVWGETIIWDNDDAYFGTDPAVDDHLNAAILLYGLYDNVNFLFDWENILLTRYFAPDSSLRYTKGNCIQNAGNITTPVLLIHCTGDSVVDVNHSRELYDNLMAYGRDCKLVEFNLVAHDFDIIPNGPFTSAGLMAKDTVLAFLDRILTGVSSPNDETPKEFLLGQNYPNPFNPSTKIEFQIADHGFVTLKVYDVLGREVATLVNEVKHPGTYQVQWNATGVASGVYSYRIQAGDLVQARKMIVLR